MKSPVTSKISKLGLGPYIIVPAIIALLSACAPKWDPPPGYRGGFLASGAQTPRTVTVQKGDSVYLIARRHNVPMKAIIETNGLKAPYILLPGQVLRLNPPLVYVVRRGDSLYAISRRHGVDMRALAQANAIAPPYTIFPGQQLAVPDFYTSVASVAKPPEPELRSPATTRRSAPSRANPVVSAPPPIAPPSPPARAGSRFVWPVDGRVISRFGTTGKGLHNDGINISVKRGASVKAVENGVVAYSGNELQGFGNLLLIKHADGWMSAYAHNDQLLVKRGEQVNRGQVISRAGASGSVKDPQLHFELRRGTKAVDPLEYLARRQS